MCHSQYSQCTLHSRVVLERCSWLLRLLLTCHTQCQLADLQQELQQAQSAATAAHQQLQHNHIAAAAAAADAQQQAAAADTVAGAAKALHDMHAGLAAALGGLQHQLLLTEAKARLLEPLATRKGLQVTSGPS